MNTKYLEIIKAPVITEKSQDLAQNKSQYVFKVDAKANKTEVAPLNPTKEINNFSFNV